MVDGEEVVVVGGGSGGGTTALGSGRMSCSLLDGSTSFSFWLFERMEVECVTEVWNGNEAVHEAEDVAPPPVRSTLVVLVMGLASCVLVSLRRGRSVLFMGEEWEGRVMSDRSRAPLKELSSPSPSGKVSSLFCSLFSLDATFRVVLISIRGN